MPTISPSAGQAHRHSRMSSSRVFGGRCVSWRVARESSRERPSFALEEGAGGKSGRDGFILEMALVPGQVVLVMRSTLPIRYAESSRDADFALEKWTAILESESGPLPVKRFPK